MPYKGLNISQDPPKASENDGYAIYKPQVQVSATLFFFEKKKIKIRKNVREFFKKCQKLKNGYFLDIKSAKIYINHHFRAPRPVLTRKSAS